MVGHTVGSFPGLPPLAAAYHALQRRGVAAPPPFAGGRRFFIAHLDGVSRAVLDHAMRRGHVPFLASLLDRGEAVLERTFAGAPASTPAFEAALFYGDRGDVPGFLWYDKKRGCEVRMDSPAECLRLEQELEARNAPGLLTSGSTYCTVVSGGASDPAIATSRLVPPLRFFGDDDRNVWDHLASTLAAALPAFRAAGAVPGRAAAAAWASARWALQVGRLKNEPMFVRNRMILSELIREFTNHLALLDVVRGVPAIYACWAGYDEVSHRRGPLHEESLAELAVADRELSELWAAMQARPELRYELFVLSDHGQEPTRPIEQVLAGPNLADWILAADAGGNVDAGAVKRRASERLTRERLSCLPFGARLACMGRATGGGGEEGRPPIVCVDAGDLAHVYFTDEKEPLDFERIARRWPARLRAAIECPASGIVAIRGGKRGFAFVRGRKIDLAEPEAMKGVLPYDGALLGDYVAAMLATPSAGDIVVYGAGVPGGDVAYAWEFGSHGGVGAGDVDTFLLRPAHAPSPGRVEGPLDLHRYFRARFVRQGRELPAAAGAATLH